jgi:hypothetical protein
VDFEIIGEISEIEVIAMGTGIRDRIPCSETNGQVLDRLSIRYSWD